jgi:hypothetical protein
MSREDRRAGRNRVRLYTRRDGLPNNTVYGILPDGDRNLWLSTNSGISRFDTATGKVVASYDSRDGLVGDEMNGGAELVASDGTLYFGGVNGVSWFHPGALPGNRYVPQVRISAVDVNGKSRGVVGVGGARGDRAGAHRCRPGDSFARWISTSPRATASAIASTTSPGSRPRTTRSTWRGWRRALSLRGAGQQQRRALEPRAGAAGHRVRAPWWATQAAYAAYALRPAARPRLRPRAAAQAGARARIRRRTGDAHSLAEANHQLALRNAQYDSLTQLPNRATLVEALGRYMRFARAPRRRARAAADQPRPLPAHQRQPGHKLGDNVLKVAAERMAAAVDQGRPARARGQRRVRADRDPAAGLAAGNLARPTSRAACRPR